MQFDTIVKGGLVATAADSFVADIGISGGRIVAIAEGLSGAARTIDAAGRWVLPGGVDAHCHFDQPSGDGSVMADDFRTGSISAACGGTTTIIPFAAQMKGGSVRAAVDDYHRRAEGKSLVDYAFHLIVSDASAQVVGQELPALIREGYTSFKIYMTYDDMKLDDRQILEVLALARREGAMTMIHAENSDCIAWLSEKLLAAGRGAPSDHAASRPMPVEREATHRAIMLSELVDVPVLIVHVSGREAIDEIRRAQSRGLRIYGETCPQYLYLSEENLGDGFEGAKCVCSPPPRDKANQRYVWEGLANGTFQIFSSDHAPFRFDGPDGKKIAGTTAPFTKIPNGVPGVETRLALLFSGGVMGKRITLQQFVALTATNPARIYGLYPRKGTIAVGADADLAIWDPARETTIRNAGLHHNVDYTPYEGIKVVGWPVTVLSRGEVIVEDGTPVDAPGRGQFLRCGLPEAAQPAGRAVVSGLRF
jgi:dihydropyrimidinase